VPRFQFYSEKSGVLYADTFSDFGLKITEYMRSGPFWLDICPAEAKDMKLLEEVRNTWDAK
jgi:hypothetical protein